MKQSMKITFSSRSNEPEGTIELGSMSLLVDMETILKVCDTFRNKFNEMGEPLDYRIEYVSEDI